MLKRQKRSASKGYTFPRLCKAIEETDGCALCTVAQRESEHTLEMLFREGIMDPGLRSRLLDAGGFCNWHAWMSIKDIRTAAAGTAIVYRELLKSVIAATTAEAKTPTGSHEHLLSSRNRSKRSLVDTTRRCSVCETVHNTENVYLHDLLEFFDDPELQPRFARSFGLCLPHLQMTIDEFQNHSNLPRLLEIEHEKFATLEGELAKFHRKRDYRFANEPPGREQSSWRRALELFARKPGVFPRQEVRR